MKEILHENKVLHEPLVGGGLWAYNQHLPEITWIKGLAMLECIIVLSVIHILHSCMLRDRLETISHGSMVLL